MRSPYEWEAVPVVATPEFLAAGEGTVSLMGGLSLIYKATADQTGGAVELHEQEIPPGVLMPPHAHERQAQLRYVLSGTLGFSVGDRAETFSAGGCVFAPPGVLHAVWNDGREPARMLELSTPGTEMTAFFSAFDRLTRSGQVTRDAIQAMAGRFGITYDLNAIPPLQQAYGVSAGGLWGGEPAR
jgi:quercetin dioxygenase-like cupin family protein